MRKINQYKTTYHKEFAAVFTALFLTLMALMPTHRIDRVEVATKETVTTIKQAVTEPTQDDIIHLIKKYFPRNGDTMVAIGMAESKLNQNAKNWNCYYNKDETIVYTSKVAGSHSTSCKVSQRKYAYSIDCFVLQKNYIGLKECPKIELEDHIKDVAQLSRVQGLGAWSTFNNKKYLAYMK